ncbi:hypothetical protein MESS4_50016 [Mesorhizobium sp. STM 4661]|nr:hypothetical protein MESS4_50016 [Mesorhizobium sp. STM 4661]
MAWCENNALDYPFGFPGNRFSGVSLNEAADDIPTV